ARRAPAGVTNSRTDRREREPSGHGDRYQTARRRAVPQPAVDVIPPAIRGTARRDPACVINGGAHGRDDGAHGRDDIERAARGAREAGRGRGQRVAGACLVDAQVREGGDAIDGRDRRGSREGPTRGVGPDRQRDAGGGGRHRVALGILDRYLHGGRDRRPGGRIAGLHRKGEIRRRPNANVEHAARGAREAGRGRGQRVAGSWVVDAQFREGGDTLAFAARRSSDVGPTRGVGPDRHRDAGGGGRHDVALGILDRHLHGGRNRRPSAGVARAARGAREAGRGGRKGSCSASGARGAGGGAREEGGGDRLWGRGGGV